MSELSFKIIKDIPFEKEESLLHTLKVSLVKENNGYKEVKGGYAVTERILFELLSQPLKYDIEYIYEKILNPTGKVRIFFSSMCSSAYEYIDEPSFLEAYAMANKSLENYLYMHPNSKNHLDLVYTVLSADMGRDKVISGLVMDKIRANIPLRRVVPLLKKKVFRNEFLLECFENTHSYEELNPYLVRTNLLKGESKDVLLGAANNLARLMYERTVTYCEYGVEEVKQGSVKFYVGAESFQFDVRDYGLLRSGSISMFSDGLKDKELEDAIVKLVSCIEEKDLPVKRICFRQVGTNIIDKNVMIADCYKEGRDYVVIFG